MISLCITGHSPAAIAAAQAALAAAGMSPARGLERDLNINFSSWHERVHQALEQSQPEPGEDEYDSRPDAAPAAMGRLWEQLANDLFLANMDAKIWGWADAKSLGLLDFWLELDGSTHFVLLATPPEQFLAEHLDQLAQEPGRRLQDLPIDSLMDQWWQAHQTMLRFALHHPKRCVLLMAELPLPADALVQAVKGAWARKLKALRADPTGAIALDTLPGAEHAAALLRYFAAELCQAYPQAQSLQHEMESVALALPAAAIGAPQALLESVLSTVSLASRVPALLRQLLDLECKVAEAEQQLPRIKDAEEKGELFLAQLHQVQEELERFYLRNTELEAELQAKAQLDEALAQERHALAQECNALAADRDAEAQAKTEAAKQRDAEAAAKAQAIAQRDALEQEKAELIAARNAEVQAGARSREQTIAAEQENELLLAQLQQVQEELERYYLRNKDLEAVAAQAAHRFSRLVSREAGGIDWESVQVEVEPRSSGSQLRCRATDVAVFGRSWDLVEFTAHINGSELTFTFDRSPGVPAVLSRWPQSANALGKVTFSVGNEAIDQDGNSLLKEISTSDWDLLHGLPKLLTNGIHQAKGPWAQSALPPQAWLEAARVTLLALQSQPPAVRVDTLRLLANRVLSGREYLVLRAEQLTLAGKRFAALEFRLGCNLGPKGEFGQNARLEFFKGDTPATFDHWAPNVKDPAGDRLDLVFVFPNGMNLKDWAAMSANDRGLVLLLADQLPALLAELRTDTQGLTRPLSDWISLSNSLRSFVRQRLDVTGLQKALPEAVAKDLPFLAGASPAPLFKAAPRAKRSPVAVKVTAKRAAQLKSAPPTAPKGRKK
jgi:hypothetical protein